MDHYSFLLILVSFIGYSISNERIQSISFQNKPDDIGFKKEYFEGDCNQDFVDPFDMLNYNHAAKKIINSRSDNVPSKSLVASCENCVSHMQRFVNLLLEATGLKDYVLTRSNRKRVIMEVVVKRSELEILQLFGNTGKVDVDVLNEVLSNIFSIGGNSDDSHDLGGHANYQNSNSFKNEKESDADTYVHIVLKQFSVLLNHFLKLPHEYPQQCIAVCVSAIFGVTFWQISNFRSWKVSISSLLFIIFSAGFGWNWIKLYRIALAKQVSARMLENATGIPIYCQPDKMSWMEYAKYFFTYEKKCEEYFKREMIDPIVEVTPTIVLSETISTLILHPADKIGFAIGIFFRELCDAVPWPYKLFIVPVVLILLAVFGTALCIRLIGIKFTFRIPFCSFEISSNHVQRSQERQFIEDIPNKPSLVNIQRQTGSEIKDSHGSTLDSSKEKPRKEIIALFKKFKEIELSDNGGGGDDESNDSDSHESAPHSISVATSKNDFGVQKAHKVSPSSEVHVHVHIPKCSGDDNPAPCCHRKNSCAALLSSSNSDSKTTLLNLMSQNDKTNDANELKNKEDSVESENSEFEQITKTDVRNLTDQSIDITKVT